MNRFRFPKIWAAWTKDSKNVCIPWHHKNDRFFLKYKGIFSHNCGYASPVEETFATFLFYIPLHQHQHLTKAPSAPPWLQAMKDPRKTVSKVGQADPATQPFERRDDSTFFCGCCQMMVILVFASKPCWEECMVNTAEDIPMVATGVWRSM